LSVGLCVFSLVLAVRQLFKELFRPRQLVRAGIPLPFCKKERDPFDEPPVHCIFMQLGSEGGPPRSEFDVRETTRCSTCETGRPLPGSSLDSDRIDPSSGNRTSELMARVRDRGVEYARLVARFDEVLRQRPERSNLFEPHPPLLLIRELGVSVDLVFVEIRRIIPHRSHMIWFPSSIGTSSQAWSDDSEQTSDHENFPNRLLWEYFKGAYDGILFFSELASLSPDDQSILNSAMRSDSSKPFDSSAEMVWPPDVIIIGAEQPGIIERKIQENGFHWDLYRRFTLFPPIVVPPLRQRKEEIPHLIQKLFHNHGSRWDLEWAGISNHFSKGALIKIHEHQWPRNEAELEWLIIRLIMTKFIENPSYIVDRRDVEELLAEFASSCGGTTLPKSLSPVSRKHVEISDEMLKRMIEVVCGDTPTPIAVLMEVLGWPKQEVREAVKRIDGIRGKAGRLRKGSKANLISSFERFLQENRML
jgi:hypothetical protein